MAHAGTPTGLAQQAGASQPWKTVLAAIAVLAIGLALVIAVMFINSRAVAPATGRDDGLIEAQRDATLLSGDTTSKVFVGGTSSVGLKVPRPLPLAPGPGVPFTTVTGTRLDTTWVTAGPTVIDESYYTSAGARNVPAVPADIRSDASTVGLDPREVIVSKTRTEDRTDVRSLPFRPPRRRHGVKGPVARDLTK